MFGIVRSAATAFHWFSVHNLEAAVLHNQIVVEHIQHVGVVVHILAEEDVVRSPAEEVAVRSPAEGVAVRSPAEEVAVRIPAEEAVVRTLAVLPDHMAAVDDFADHIPAVEVAHSPAAHNPADIVEAGSYNLGHTPQRHVDLVEVRHTVILPKDENFARLSYHKRSRSRPSIV